MQRVFYALNLNHIMLHVQCTYVRPAITHERQLIASVAACFFCQHVVAVQRQKSKVGHTNVSGRVASRQGAACFLVVSHNTARFFGRIAVMTLIVTQRPHARLQRKPCVFSGNLHISKRTKTIFT